MDFKLVDFTKRSLLKRVLISKRIPLRERWSKTSDREKVNASNTRGGSIRYAPPNVMSRHQAVNKAARGSSQYFLHFHNRRGSGLKGMASQLDSVAHSDEQNNR